LIQIAFIMGIKKTTERDLLANPSVPFACGICTADSCGPCQPGSAREHADLAPGACADRTRGLVPGPPWPSGRLSQREPRGEETTSTVTWTRRYRAGRRLPGPRVTRRVPHLPTTSPAHSASLSCNSRVRVDQVHGSKSVSCIRAAHSTSLLCFSFFKKPPVSHSP
jgi:hypothetical protein